MDYITKRLCFYLELVRAKLTRAPQISWKIPDDNMVLLLSHTVMARRLPEIVYESVQQSLRMPVVWSSPPSLTEGLLTWVSFCLSGRG